MKSKADIQAMAEAAERVSALMKTLGHKDRLLVLCNLAEGERAVGELAADLGLSQSSLSQHLARMRNQGLVETRRDWMSTGKRSSRRSHATTESGRS